MKEVGIVTAFDGQFAIVKVDKKDECSKCGMCLFPKNANSVDFSAENTVGANIGDQVIIEMQNNGKLVGAVLAFLVPLVLIILSAVVTYVFIKKEIWMLILSVISIILWYTVLAVIDKRLKKSFNFSSKIVSVIKVEENIDG